MTDFVYRTCGLVLSSALALPELEPAKGPPDVAFIWGSVPRSLEAPRTRGPFHAARPGQFLFEIAGVARYLVEGGSRVTIDPCPGASEATVRFVLLNTVLAVLLHQRGDLLPLHASAVDVGGGAVVLTGKSGAGKSTLAAELVRRGCGLLSDDLAPLRPADGRAEVLPVFPRLNLWADAVRHFGSNTEFLERVRPEVEQYGVPVAPPSKSKALPVCAIYILTPEERQEMTLTPIGPVEKLETLFRTAGIRFLDGLGLRAAHLEMVARLVPLLSFKRFRRPIGPMCVAAMGDALLADLEAGTGASESASTR